MFFSYANLNIFTLLTFFNLNSYDKGDEKTL